jgi:hypothetical protein
MKSGLNKQPVFWGQRMSNSTWTSAKYNVADAPDIASIDGGVEWATASVIVSVVGLLMSPLLFWAIYKKVSAEY